MSATRYYRVFNPEALAAWDAYVAAEAALKSCCESFALGYPGAKPVYASSVHGKRFHGLRFHPVKVSPLWTIAQERDGFIQRPRSALPKSFKGDRKAVEQERRALVDTWLAGMPSRSINESASLDALWKSLGTDWGNLLFNGIQWFRRGDVIYVATSAALATSATEITGSEFDKAKAKGGEA